MANVPVDCPPVDGRLRAGHDKIEDWALPPFVMAGPEPAIQCSLAGAG